MSIKVTIEHSGRAFGRTITIDRITTPTLNAEGWRDQSEVGIYQAVLLKGRIEDCQDGAPVATFEHRYGDDLLTLVAEAIDALGGRGGPSTTGLKR